VSPAFGRARAGSRAFPKPLAYEVGPWRGVRDIVDPTVARRDVAYAAQNMYPESAELGGGWVGRPGFTRASFSQQLGTVSSRRVQLVTEFTKLNGTSYAVLVCGGVFYTYSFSTGLFTSHSLGSLTLDDEAKVYGVTFADRLILSDGINKPIAWDGSAFVELTNCPVLFGKPWVYYAKLFGIKATERSTIVWSEEADPTLGYEAGGYNNAWTLGQTDQDPLYAGVGFNEAMLVFRARSMTQILGAVNDDFQSSGTREGVSETIGTTSPDALVVVGRTVFFLDADRRPQRYTINGSIDDEPAVWENARSTIANIATDSNAVTAGAYYPTIDVVLYAVVGRGFTDPSFLMTFDGSNAAYLGVWTGFPVTAFGFWTDDNDRIRLVHGATDGYPYLYGVPGGTAYNDELVTGTAPVEHYLETGPIGYDIQVEKQFDRVDVGVRATTAITDCRVRLATSAGTGPEAQLTFAGGVALWDDAEWDEAVWTSESSEQHGALGTDTIGRWCRVQVRHAVLGETIGVMRVAVGAYALGDYPKAP
jgi:hypothetical protein